MPHLVRLVVVAACAAACGHRSQQPIVASCITVTTARGGKQIEQRTVSFDTRGRVVRVTGSGDDGYELTYDDERIARMTSRDDSTTYRYGAHEELLAIDGARPEFRAIYTGTFGAAVHPAAYDGIEWLVPTAPFEELARARFAGTVSAHYDVPPIPAYDTTCEFKLPTVSCTAARGGPKSFTFDAQNRLVRIDAEQASTAFTYDGDHLVQVHFSDPSFHVERLDVYSYDRDGRLASVARGDVTTTYEHTCRAD
jgi:YD repeat-containing protein